MCIDVEEDGAALAAGCDKAHLGHRLDLKRGGGEEEGCKRRKKEERKGV